MKNKYANFSTILFFSLASLGASNAIAREATTIGEFNKKFLASKNFKAAKEKIAFDFDTIINDTVTLTEIAAPPFLEQNRAIKFKDMLIAHGLENVEIDEVGNVLGIRKGNGKSNGVLVVAAHLDTVFSKDTDVKVRREGNRLYAPGIGDDTVSLAVMLGIIRALDAGKIQTNKDILFVGDVGEEGPGNLRGTRHLFQKGKYKDKITQFISLEPGLSGEIVDIGIGSKRYKVDFTGPGGHSYGDFGIVNPAYAMADAITRFTKYPNPLIENTVYNVGIVAGGTSVNSIPFNVSMTVDMRSASDTELNKISKYFLDQLPLAVEFENKTRSQHRGSISYKVETIGERPSGKTLPSANIYKITDDIYKKMGYSLKGSASSTDSNIPMSLGIEALTLGSGIGGDGAHSPKEFIEIDKDNNIKSISTNVAIIAALASN